MAMSLQRRRAVSRRSSLRMASLEAVGRRAAVSRTKRRSCSMEPRWPLAAYLAASGGGVNALLQKAPHLVGQARFLAVQEVVAVELDEARAVAEGLLVAARVFHGNVGVALAPDQQC